MVMFVRHPSSSLFEMSSPPAAAAGPAATSTVDSATPETVMRLALDRQRLLLSLQRQFHPTPPPPPPHTVSASTQAATNLIDPSAFCLPSPVGIPDWRLHRVFISARCNIQNAASGAVCYLPLPCQILFL